MEPEDLEPEDFECPMCGDIALLDTDGQPHRIWCTKCGLELLGNLRPTALRLLWERMLIAAPDAGSGEG